jgi:hypothetical protein
MEVLDIIAFKSTTRIFALFVIGLILVYHKCKGSSCRCLPAKQQQQQEQQQEQQVASKCQPIRTWMIQRFSFSSALHGLAAFFVLVYSRFLSYCGNLFGRSVIISSNPNAPSVELVRLQGNMPYYQDVKHIIYSSFTLVFILFIILPPVVLLLVYPSLHQIQQIAIHSRFAILRNIFRYKVFGMFNTPKVQLFADLFQSSYKHEYRFFAGVLLFARIGILMVWNLVGSRAAGFAVLAALCLGILLLHSLLQPNIKNWINVLDTLIYSHMTAITLLAVYINSSGDDPHMAALQSLYLVGIFIPAIYPVVYLGRKLFFNCKLKVCKRGTMCTCCSKHDVLLDASGRDDHSVQDSLQNSSYVDIHDRRELWWSS